MSDIDKSALVSDTIPLVHSIVRYMHTPKWIDKRDLSQSGVCGLINAAKNWDSSGQSGPFRHYARKCIKGEIAIQVRKEWRRGLTPNRYDPARCETFEDVTDIHPALESTSVTDKIFVSQILSLLPDNMRHVIDAVYLQGIQQVDIAHQLGVSKAAICKMRTRALDKIRQICNADTA